MKDVNHVAMAAAVVTAISATPALAAKKCDIIGTFTDTLGSKGKFVSEKKGTVSNSVICAQPYKLTVTKLNEAVVDVKGTSKDNSCGALTGDFAFQNGGCTSAAGTVTIQGLGSFNDTITHTGKDISHTPVTDTSLLTAGFR
jgi:hypothetical protein